MSTTIPSPLLDTVLNLSRFHREHEKYYGRAPLEQAIAVQRASLTLKTLADRWSRAEPDEHPIPNPYAGCDDLNEPAAIQQDGVLFMEGEQKPAELLRLERDLRSLADDLAAAGEWLARAMESSWETVRALLPVPQLAGVLGERHRIIANDWQNAGIAALAGRLVSRALDVLEQVDFAPAAVRADLAEERVFPGYLYSAAELLDRAADLLAESATLVHENERRWRVFRETVRRIETGEV
jgi:hypothetical protein